MLCATALLLNCTAVAEQTEQRHILRRPACASLSKSHRCRAKTWCSRTSEEAPAAATGFLLLQELSICSSSIMPQVLLLLTHFANFAAAPALPVPLIRLSPPYRHSYGQVSVVSRVQGRLPVSTGGCWMFAQLCPALSTTHHACCCACPSLLPHHHPAEPRPLQCVLRPERLSGGADHRPVQVLLPRERLLQQALVGAVWQAAVHFKRCASSCSTCCHQTWHLKRCSR